MTGGQEIFDDAAGVNIVFLSGGFSGELAQDVRREQQNSLSTVSMQDRKVGSRTLLLRGGIGKERVPIGLVPVNEKPVLMYWMHSLLKCERLKPLRRFTYIVCNDIDYDEYAGSKGLIDDMGNNIDFDPNHVIKNGCNQASDWGGEVKDMQTALQVIGTKQPTFFISCRCLVWPEFNFQRIIEHSLIRGHNVIGFRTMTNTDILLQKTGKPSIELNLSSETAVPKVQSFNKSIKSNQIGSQGSVPICMLSPSAQERVLSESPAINQTIEELFCDLVHWGQQAFGIDMGWGCFFVNRLSQLNYTDQYFYWYYQTHKSLHCAKKIFNSNDTDFVLGDDVNDLGAIKRLDRRQWAVLLQKELGNSPTAEFDAVYFGQQQAQNDTTAQQYYKLPSNFYITTYTQYNLLTEKYHKQNSTGLQV